MSEEVAPEPSAATPTEVPGHPARYGGSKRNTGKKAYAEAVELFRRDPGKCVVVAKKLGINYRTAKRWWCGPKSRAQPWATPIRELLGLGSSAEDLIREKELEAAAQAAKKLSEEIERRRAEREENQRVEAAVMKAARNNVLRGLVSLSRTCEGVDLLAQRIGEQLRRGTDASGAPLDIKPREAFNLIRSFTMSTKSLVEAAEALVAVERVKQGLPTDIVNVQIADNVTLTDAKEALAIADRAVKRAEKLGLVSIAGGKARKAVEDAAIAAAPAVGGEDEEDEDAVNG